jgi:hypothetical protein
MLKRYIGVKVVQAEPEAKDGVEGYKVIYSEPDKPDYTSWCPKDVFERHNRETSAMPFSLALEAARKGATINRKERVTVDFSEGYFVVHFDSTACRFTPTDEDMTSDDWHIVD